LSILRSANTENRQRSPVAISPSPIGLAFGNFGDEISGKFRGVSIAVCVVDLSNPTLQSSAGKQPRPDEQPNSFLFVKAWRKRSSGKSVVGNLPADRDKFDFKPIGHNSSADQARQQSRSHRHGWSID
jgi:hypothetical protein